MSYFRVCREFGIGIGSGGKLDLPGVDNLFTVQAAPLVEAELVRFLGAPRGF
jgi:hypothetical protein